jgi:general secretion pathway protein D
MVRRERLTTTLTRVLITFLLVFSFLKAGNDEVQLNINDMEIEDFIKMVAKIDNRNILIPLNVRGKINYISKKPIPKKNIFHLLQMILKDKGFTIIDSGKGYYIVSRISDAHKDAPDIKDFSKEDIIHTAIIPVKNMDANKISVSIKNFLSRSGKLIISSETNSLVITDLPENIQTIRTLMKRLDKRPDLEIEFFELKYLKANDAFTQLKGIADTVFDQKIDAEKVSIFKNDSSNILTVVAERTQIDKLKEFLSKIDKPDQTTKQNIYFIKLNNADAEEIVKTITQVVAKKVYEKNEARASITFDKELNSLVLISSEIEYNELMELIAQLDIERKQVYVKARIVEISESKAKNLGVKYGLNAFNVNEGGLYTLASTLNGGSALAFSGLSIPTNLTQGFGLGVGLSFLSSNGVSNTLSEPSILCVNNQESSIYVGQTESILSSSATGTTTTALTQNSYTREDIGLTLKIKPRISNDNKVILTVDTTLEDVVAGSGGGLPTTTKREVKTIAVVKDGEAVIVGGLIKDKVTESESKVPLLGDIPLLGSLFKDTTYTTDKVNLVIILTPYIVEKSSDLEKLRENLQQMSKLEQEVVQKMIDDGLEKEGEVETLLSNAKTRTESVEPRKGIDFDD